MENNKHVSTVLSMDYGNKTEKANTGRPGPFCRPQAGYQLATHQNEPADISRSLGAEPGAAQGAEIGGRDAIEELWQRCQQPGEKIAPCPTRPNSSTEEQSA